MASGGTRITAELLRVLAFGGIGVPFVRIGDVFANPIRLLSIKNNTDVGLFFSYDGVTPQEYIPAQTGIVLDFTSNSGAHIFPFMPVGAGVYVAQITAPPTSGFVAVSAYYCLGD